MFRGAAEPAPAPPPAALVLAIAGACLSLSQFASLREFSALLGSNEVVAFIVLGGYFLGLSAGYSVSRRLSHRALLRLGGATLALHATLPFSARFFAGAMGAIRLDGNVPPVIFLLVLCGMAPFYAVFLPRLVDGARGAGAGPSPLVRFYAAELAGACAGLALVVLITPARMGMLLSIHLAGLLALYALYAGPRRRGVVALFALLPLYGAGYAALDRASLTWLYARTHTYKDVEIVASEFSPYQRIDLVRAVPSRRVPATYLYLDGNLFYGSRSLHQHNLFVSLLPNVLYSPTGAAGRACVIAGGSLDNARHLAPRARSLDVVELDEAVVRLTRRHIQEPQGDFPANWRLHIDDGKHFLGTWGGEPFDVISVDVPIPVHLQTAMLHSKRFFEVARSRLAPGGILSISLASRLDPPPGSRVSLSNRILAGLLAVFPRVTVARGENADFAWASDRPLPFDAAAAQARMDIILDVDKRLRKIMGEPKIEFVGAEEIRQAVEGVEPIGDSDMRMVLRLAVGKFWSRYYEP